MDSVRAPLRSQAASSERDDSSHTKFNSQYGSRAGNEKYLQSQISDLDEDQRFSFSAIDLNLSPESETNKSPMEMARSTSRFIVDIASTPRSSQGRLSLSQDVPFFNEREEKGGDDNKSLGSYPQISAEEVSEGSESDDYSESDSEVDSSDEESPKTRQQNAKGLPNKKVGKKWRPKLRWPHF
mmetsp:Transcript_18683/g.24663  ORF Transcript_18683/g.24663 Transcript_18683/m.24663 type:complete len:183 (-) Transcript_18683:286-834(-)